MPREEWPTDVAFVVMTKRAGQQKFQNEGEFIPDPENRLGNGPYEEGQARIDADALMAELVAGHSGGTKEYVMLRCQVYGGWSTIP